MAALVAGLALPAVAQVPLLRLRRVFTAFCDTLIPADALTPAASELGVVQTLLDDIASDARAQRLASVGCMWLNEQADGDFAAGSVEAREAIVQRMSELAWEAPPQRFYALVRNTVMLEYYAQPASWRGLALTRAPQPLGFFDAVRR